MEEQCILVLSDTHGCLLPLKAVLQWAKSRTFAAAVFLGDGADDLGPASLETGFALPWIRVRGNGDSDPAIPEFDTLETGGCRFFLTHGHRYSLHGGYDALCAAAKNHQARAALFGHLHIPFADEEDGVMLINPGSLGRPRSRMGASFATIACAEGRPPRPIFWGLAEQGGRIKIERLRA